MDARAAIMLALVVLIGVCVGILAGLLLAAWTGESPLVWLGRSLVEGLETIAFMLMAILPAPRPRPVVRPWVGPGRHGGRGAHRTA